MVTHAFVILYASASHAHELPAVFARRRRTDSTASRPTLGFWPLAFILLRAYSMGGGTYTGIEAVSNGVADAARAAGEDRQADDVPDGRSLAFTAGGILFGYLLVGARPRGKTMNASSSTRSSATGARRAAPSGRRFVIALLVAEAALLFVAAQAGFLDGPRVLANMALDSWVPHRFSQLSDRLVTKNGVFLMGVAAVAALLYTRGTSRCSSSCTRSTCS